ncbi:fructose-1,6-bisphosphatase/inositol monophosphatase family enzyme [Kutzneria kofuensis]|uniref:Fructose-1,6-bisphosphatase/inositol monophosphatase family enzyme n=1 Tax=Kutzneria kofuensis TaxID=103725 RepID=A0A7W9NES0_9PSEU|nr:inositol monophosphatase family protein [Kutzneria kofuensis]MBB5890617.1 fructose-1,6-bisphosphatase/inositol monophosphatase family enzyme [Kutzneria kofuensis]
MTAIGISMSTFDTARLLAVAHGAMDKAINLLMRKQTGEVQAKGDRDLVTEVELAIERLVRDHLREHTPDVGFIGEETGATGNLDVYWVLDPVDGTVNFVHGIPLCAVALGLVHADQPLLGVIDTPFLRHRYWATRGHGAFRDGDPIAVSRARALEDSVISFSDYGAGEEVQFAPESPPGWTKRFHNARNGFGESDHRRSSWPGLPMARSMPASRWATAAGTQRPERSLLARRARSSLMQTAASTARVHAAPSR